MPRWLIDWKQRTEFGNPDFVVYADSFGIAGIRLSCPRRIAAYQRAIELRHRRATRAREATG